MNKHKLLLLAIGCTWALGAAAQWQWIDRDGRKVFSDRPPSQEIPEKNILRQPGGNSAARAAPAAIPAEDTPGAAASPSVAALPRPTASAPTTGKDKVLEERKAQAEAAEEAKKKAEEAKLAKAKAENCTRARQAKAAFVSGRPITQSNAQGERIFLDEAGRTAETKRIDGVIAADCAR